MPRRISFYKSATLACVLWAEGPGLQATTNYVTTTNNSGPGSLRQAILAVNTDGGGAIMFSNVTGVITLQSELPAVSANLSIRGPGSELLTISGNNSNRIFVFNAGTTSIVSGLTIAQGCAVDGDGGAIYNRGDLTVSRSLLFSNSVRHSGGAIFSSGVLRINSCTISSNSAVGSDYRIFHHGGAIYATNAIVSVENSRLTDNRCGELAADGAAGGALSIADGILDVINCDFERNAARGRGTPTASPLGGGMHLARTTTSILHSRILTNVALGVLSANSVGGGVYAWGGRLVISNCILGWNVSRGGEGQPGFPRPLQLPS